MPIYTKYIFKKCKQILNLDIYVEIGVSDKRASFIINSGHSPFYQSVAKST